MFLELFASPSASLMIGSADYLYIKVQILDHSHDDGKLLGILLSKVCSVRCNYIEELSYNCTYTLEMY